MAAVQGRSDILEIRAGLSNLRATVDDLLERLNGLDLTAAATPREQIAGLIVDREAWRATLNGEQLTLSRLEFQLLEYLESEPYRVADKKELRTNLWGGLSDTSTRTIDSHACRLRQQLAAKDPTRSWIPNVPGVGYALLPRPLEQR